MFDLTEVLKEQRKIATFERSYLELMTNGLFSQLDNFIKSDGKGYVVSYDVMDDRECVYHSTDMLYRY